MSLNHFEAGNENTVSVKLPQFGVGNSRVWFTQVEAYFRFRKITSQATMFAYVATQLPSDIASEVIDILDPMPTEAPYDKLKTALLKRTSASEVARFQKLISGMELGDRTPSQLLRHMKALAGDIKLDEAVLRQLWIKCLPPNTTAILSVQDGDLPLDKLADVADKIHECFFKPSISRISEDSKSEANLLAVIGELQKQVTELSLQVNHLRHHDRRNASRNRSQSKGRNYKVRKTGVCYYHKRFGDKSTRCTLPCSHPAAFNKGLPCQGNSLASQ